MGSGFSFQRERDDSEPVLGVGPEGFEPSAIGLKVRCSTGLSYRPFALVAGTMSMSSLKRKGFDGFPVPKISLL